MKSVAWLMALSLVPAVGAAVAAQAPLAAYGRLPAVEDMAISPDGATLATITTQGDDRFIVLADARTFAPIVRMPTGVKKVRGLVWAGPRHLIITTSTASSIPDVLDSHREWAMAIDVDLQKRKARVLLRGIPETIDSILGAPMIRTVKGHPMAFLSAYHFDPEGKGHPALFRVDLDHDVTTMVEDGQAHDNDWLVDSDGEALARDQFDPVSGRWTIKLKRSGTWRTAVEGDDKISPPDLSGLGRESDTVLVDTDEGDFPAVHELDRNATELGRPLAVGPGLQLIRDPMRRTLIGYATLVGDSATVKFFDRVDQARWDGLVKAYSGARVSLVSMSDDRSKMAVLVDPPDETPAYALVDFATGRSRWIGDTYPGVAKPLAAQTAIAFEAGDGLRLSGYLTTPRLGSGKPLPLIVFPHGGPAARDEPGFDWWAQAMASRGYAVLQVNFRGSDGFGAKFQSAGWGQYGRKMQTDLSDGVKYLVAKGLVDPARVCIVGASYGGYAALAGAALDAGRYRCAVAVAGIADMRRMVAWDKDRTSVATERYWRRYVGATGDPAQSFNEISPIQHIDAVKIPILLIHGKDDTVVAYEQSEMMAAALKKAGKPVQLVTLKAEDHWLSRSETRLQMLEAVMAFLQKNNPAD